MTENQKTDNIKSGFIYILYNEVFNYYGENVFKIGKTNNIEHRLKAYTTSYIKPCEIKFLSSKCINYDLAESFIFELLNKYRIVNNREFFKIDKADAINIIEEVIYKINNGIPFISKKQKNDKTEKPIKKIKNIEVKPYRKKRKDCTKEELKQKDHEKYQLQKEKLINNEDFMINNFKSWFNNTFERTDHKKDSVQLKFIFTQYKQNTFYNNLNKQGKRHYNKKHFIKMFRTLYNQYLKTNNNGVYIY